MHLNIQYICNTIESSGGMCKCIHRSSVQECNHMYGLNYDVRDSNPNSKAKYKCCKETLSMEMYICMHRISVQSALMQCMCSELRVVL